MSVPFTPTLFPTTLSRLHLDPYLGSSLESRLLVDVTMTDPYLTSGVGGYGSRIPRLTTLFESRDPYPPTTSPTTT